MRKARNAAARLLALLSQLDNESVKLFPNGDDAANAADIAEGFENSDPAVSIVAPLVAVIEDIKSLQTSTLRRLAVATPPPTNSDPLARHFISAMGDAYLRFRGKQPPRGRTGPFVRLLQAAWIDLGFPTPITNDRFGRGPKDLNEWLGLKVQERAKGLQG